MAQITSKGTPDLVFGAGGIGSTTGGWFTNTWTNTQETDELLEYLKAHNIHILDGASGYPPGNPGDTSRLLGLANTDGFSIDTKISPTGRDDNGKFKPFLSRELVNEIFTKDLALLGVEKVRCLYIHADDPAESIAEQAYAMDQQVRKGRCEMVGLSNYTVARLTEYLKTCEEQGLTKPKIYQCHYNALVREIEATGHMLDVCRRHGVNIYAYSPLAGGFLSGKFTMAKDAGQEQETQTMAGTRWQIDSPFQMYLSIFNRSAVHDAMRNFIKTCAAQNPPVEPAEASLRWLANHSALGAGDGIILGASKLSQISRSTDALKKGPLSEAVCQAVEMLWVEAQKDLTGRGNTM